MKIQELIAQILTSRKITRLNQQQLMSAMMSKNGLDEQDLSLIDRVFYSVQNGLVRVVD